MAKNMTFTKAKKKREELQLPILHFIVADDWIDKLGMDAFRAWLKMYTWCDRTDVTSTQHKVPRSLSKAL